MGDEELEDVKTFVAQNPTAGIVIRGSGSARKARIPITGRGKSGGYRIITFYSGADFPVFLLDIYAKSQKDNLTQAETNELRFILASIVQRYRESSS